MGLPHRLLLLLHLLLLLPFLAFSDDFFPFPLSENWANCRFWVSSCPYRLIWLCFVLIALYLLCLLELHGGMGCTSSSRRSSFPASSWSSVPIIACPLFLFALYLGFFAAIPNFPLPITAPSTPSLFLTLSAQSPSESLPIAAPELGSHPTAVAKASLLLLPS